MKTALNKGFTLVEMSIVMLILAVLTGSILVGKDLIHAAEIRATVKQAEMFSLAYNTFQLKFNCIPGDCNNAVDMGFKDGFTIYLSKRDTMSPDDVLEYLSPVSTAYALTLPDQKLVVDGSLPPVPEGGSGSVPSTGSGKGGLEGSKLPDGLIPLNGNYNCLLENNPSNSQMEGPVGFHMLEESHMITDLEHEKTRVYLKLSTALATIGNKSFPAFWVVGNLSAGKDGKGFPSVIDTPGVYLQVIASFQPFAAGSLPVVDAANIDRKIDDGLPLAGSIRATSTTQTNLSIGPTYSATRDLGANNCLIKMSDAGGSESSGSNVSVGGTANTAGLDSDVIYNINSTNNNAKCAQVIRLGIGGCRG